MPGSRRFFLSLIALSPFAASGQLQLIPKVGQGVAREMRREAARSAWPDQRVQYIEIYARLGEAARTVGAEDPNPRVVTEIVDAMRPAEQGPHYLAIGCPNDRLGIRTILTAFLYNDLTPPLQLHLAFIGTPKYGEQLRPHIGPLVADYRVIDPYI